MAYYSFTQKIARGVGIQVYKHGDMYRDFTYIDDIVDGILQLLHSPSTPAHEIFNIGGARPEKLSRLIEILEEQLGRKARIEMLPMQPGDVSATYAGCIAPGTRRPDMSPKLSLAPVFLNLLVGGAVMKAAIFE